MSAAKTSPLVVSIPPTVSPDHEEHLGLFSLFFSPQKIPSLGYTYMPAAAMALDDVDDFALSHVQTKSSPTEEPSSDTNRFVGPYTSLTIQDGG